MKKKVTIKDVAREAGVSVATVSYIINNRKDQKISPETEKKVLQMINLLNYIPNRAAKSLVTSKSQTVALYFKEHTFSLKNAEQLHFINQLSTFLYSKNYHLMCLSEKNIEQFDLADAIITLDISKDDFHKIGNDNFVPLIAVDSFIDDPLFFQINSDYEHFKVSADQYFKGQEYTLVSLPIQNSERRTKLINTFPNVLFIDSLEQFNNLSQGRFLLLDHTLSQALSTYCDKFYIPNISVDKFEHIFQAIEWTSQRREISNHNILV